MPSKERDITPKMLLEHMQQMDSALKQELREARRDFLLGIRGVEHRLTQRIERVERTLTQQIDAIDLRLDDLEIE